MPRRPVVSRNMTVSVCSVLMVDIEAGDTFTQEIIIPRQFKTNEQLMKAIRSASETEQLKPVNIRSVSVEERRYYMSEQEFIDQAHITEKAAEPVPEPKEVKKTTRTRQKTKGITGRKKKK